MLAAGFSAIHTRRLCDHPEDVARYMDAMVSATWLRQPQYLLVTQVRTVRKSGRVNRDELRDVLSGLLVHPEVQSVSLIASAKPVAEAVAIDVETRPAVPTCARSFGRHWLPDPDASAVDPWIRMVVEFLDTVRAAHAVLFVMEDDAALSEGSMGRITKDGVVQHPYPDQFHRMWQLESCELGTKYVRFPRWGTLYSHDQVAALGGRATIEAAVQPAIARELSGGVYFQITESVATATSAESLAKQRAFEQVAAPLLPPALDPRNR